MQQTAAEVARPLPRITVLTIALWFLAALLEGIDLQSAGIAGPGLAKAFALDQAQLGNVFSIGNAGLAISAALGGWLADRFGRKRVLVAAVAMFGVFSLATAQAWSYHSLLAARALTGLGLGAAIPNLIALVFETTRSGQRTTIVGAMYCGMPLGSAAAAAIGWAGLQQYGWQLIFYCGGLAPVIIAPLLAFFLRESPAFEPEARAARALAQSKAEPVLEVLAGGRRLGITLALWLSSWCTYFVLYLQLSWLPSLLVRNGLPGALASASLILFNLGGVAGILTGGALMDRWKHRTVVSVIFAGALVMLAILANVVTHVPSFAILMLCAFLGDYFVAASQMVEYGIAPLYYPTAGRGTGVGAMVGIGRTGAIAGPWMAGQMQKTMGAGSAAVLLSGAPGLALSALALLWALSRTRASIVK